ncbi:MAG: DUF3794 domain-containing protein [Clostridium sp.]
MAIVNRYSVETTGAMTFTGNTLGLSQLLDTNQAGPNNSIGAFTSLDTLLQVPTFPPGTTLNYTQNGSEATLVIPPGSTVLYAELIWGGNYAYDYQDTSVIPLPPPVSQDLSGVIDDPVIFTAPGQPPVAISPDPATGGETTFTVDIPNFFTTTNYWYSRTADVTSIIQAAGPGVYSLESVPGLVAPISNQTTSTNHAGWTLAVIYENPALPQRGMNLWVGAELVIAPESPQVDIFIDGFETIPSGAVQANLLLSTQEGDPSIPNDFVQFGPDAGSLTTISGPNNPSNNFFGSQINNDSGTIDTTGTFGTLNGDPFTNTQLSPGRQGWDITNVDVSPEVANSQTSALIRLATQGDAYMVNAVGLQVDVLALDVQATKSVDKAFADVGDVLTYTIDVVNGLGSNVDITSVSLLDAIPSGTTFVPNSVFVDGVQQIGADPSVGVSLPDLAIGESTQVTFQVTVDTIPDPNPIPNEAIIDFNYGLDDSRNTNIVTTQVNRAVLESVKSVDLAFAEPGDTLTYSTVLTNTGSATATNIVFTDLIPTGTTFVPDSVFVDGVQQLGADPSLGVSIPDIPPGGSRLITFQVTVDNAIPNPNPIVNNNSTSYQYFVDPADPPVTAPDAISNDVTTQINQAILEAIKSVDKAVAQFGETLVYTTVITNTGNVTATNVNFIDAIPAGTTFVPGSVTINGVPQPGFDPSVGFPLPDILPGGSVTVSFSVTVDNGFPPENPIPNTSDATYEYLVDPQGAPVVGPPVLSNTVFTQIDDVILTPVKSVDLAFADIGDTLTYTITVTNTGNTTATGGILTDTIPAGTTFVPGSVTVAGAPQPGADPQAGIALPDIPPGGSVVVTFQVTVDSTLPIPTQVDNTALLDYPGKPTTPSNTVVTEINHAQLDLVKSVSDDYADFGSVITYTTVITNVGNTDAENVVFTDSIPSGTTFVPGSVIVGGVPQPGADPQVGVNIGTIPAGGSVTVSFNVIVDSAIPTPNPIENTSSADYEYVVEPGTPPVIAPTSTSNTVETLVNRAILVSTKSVDKDFADWGEVITYSVDIENVGSTTAINVEFEDLIPAGTTLVPGSVTINGAPQPGLDPSVPFPLPDIPVGGVVTVTFQVTVNDANPVPNPIPNSSTTYYDYLVDPLGTPVTATPSQSNIVNTQVNHAQLDITKAVDLAVVTLGDVITYTVNITNTGNVDSQNTVLTDIIPPETTFVPGSVTIDGVPAPGADPAAGISIPNIAPGATVVVVFQVTAPLVLPAQNPMLNNAFVDYAYEVDPTEPIVTAPTETSNTVETLVIEQGDVATLEVTKAVDKAFVEVGDTLLYTITVDNTGNTDALDVTITDIVPSGTTFIPGSVTIDGVPAPGADIQAGVNIGTVSPGVPRTITFEVQVGDVLPVPNPIVNGASVDYQFRTDPDLDPIDGPTTPSNDVTTLVKLVSVEISKQVNTQFANRGDVLTYTIIVENTGNTDATDVILTDIIPSGTTFVADSLTVDGVPQIGADPSLGYNIGGVSPSQIKIVTFEVLIGDVVPDPNPIPNTASIVFDYRIDPAGPDITEGPIDSNTVFTTVNYADITVEKAVDKAYADFGEEVEYTLTITNTGNVDAENVTLIDSIPSGTTFVPGSVTVGGVPQPGEDPSVGVNVGTIAPGASVVVTFKVLVGNTFPVPNPFLNSGFAQYEYRVDPAGGTTSATSPDSNVVETTVSNASLDIVKSVDKSYAKPGDEIEYTISVTNTGNTTALGVVLTDIVPSGTTFAPGSVTINAVATPGADPNVGINLGNIPAGGTVTVTFKVLIGDTLPDPNPLVNQASADYTYLVDPAQPPVGGSDSSNSVTTQVNIAVLDVTKTTNKEFVGVNGVITYTSTIRNTGNVNAVNVVFTDPIPAGTTLVPNSVFVNGVLVPGGDPSVGVPVPNIPPGGIAVVTFQVQVNGAVPTPNPIPNISEVDYGYFVDPEDTAPFIAPTVFSNEVFTEVRIAKLVAVKSVDKAYADLGETIKYTIAITNQGNVKAENVVLSDLIPDGTTFVAGSVLIDGVPVPGANPDPSMDLPDIDPGQTIIVEFSVLVGDVVPTTNPVQNTGVINYDFIVDPTGQPVVGEPAVTNTVETQINTAALVMVKSVDNQFKDLGDTIKYTVSITNTGNTVANNVVFTDALQADTSFVPGTVTIDGVPSPGANPESGVPIGNINPGQTVIVEFEVLVVSVPESDVVLNTASTEFNYIVDPAKPPVNASSTSNETVVNILHGEILPENLIKSANKEVTTPGDIITYTVSAKNTGNTPINLVLSDVLPVGVEFVAGSVIIDGVNKPLEDPGVGINVGQVLPGETVTIQFKVVVLDNAPDPITNTAKAIYSYTVDPTKPPVSKETISNEVVIDNVIPELTLVKSASKDVAAVGDVITYTIVATNTGEVNLDDVVVKDLLEPDLNFVEGTVKVDGFPYPDYNILTGFSIGSLAVGQTKVVTFEAKIVNKTNSEVKNISTGVFTFKITPDGEERVEQTNSNEVTIILEKPQLTISKVADKSVVSLGDTINYKVSLVNTGDTELVNVVFYDEVPSSLEYVPDSLKINGVKVNAQSIDDGVNIGTIGVGEEVIIEYQAKVVSGSCSGYGDNLAYATYEYVLSDKTFGEGVTDKVTARVELNISTFKQMSIDKLFTIPCQKPDMESADDIVVDVIIDDSYVINTPVITSNEGQVLSGYKLIVHGRLKISLEYTACVMDQAIHSAHFEVPFSQFIIMPKNYEIGQYIDVSSIIEKVDVDMIDERTISASVMLLLVGKAK